MTQAERRAEEDRGEIDRLSARLEGLEEQLARSEAALDEGGNTIDELEERGADVVLLPDEPHECSEEDAELFRGTKTRAAQAGAVQFVSGKDLFWPGAWTVDGVQRLRDGDYVSALAFPLPAEIVFRFIGFPREDDAMIKAWCVNRRAFSWGKPTEAEQVEIAQGMIDYWRYCREFVAA